MSAEYQQWEGILIREYTFTPKCFEGTELTGTITVKVPHAKEKAGFLKTLKYKLNAEGQVEASQDLADMLVGMIEIAEQVILSADIKSGESVFTKDDIFYVDELSPIINEVGQLMMTGFKPSKN